MELNKENILFKSDHGLDLYQLVLGNKLVTNGSKSKNLKNPFYQDTKAALSIFYREGQWLFNDFGNPDYSGDVFHFAALHYNLDSKSGFIEILQKMNQDLNLGLVAKSNDSKFDKKVKAIMHNSKRDANAFQKRRGISQTKHFYQSNAYNEIPASVIFFNHNKTGYEQRYIADKVELLRLGLPKTKFYGTKRNTIYDSTYKESDRVSICEGANNALSFAQIGESAIATFGVGNIPNAAILQKLIENKVVYLAGDGDNEGRKFNSALVEQIANANIPTKEIYSIEFPEGKDANDLLMEGNLSDYKSFRKRQFPLYNFSKIITSKEYKEEFPIHVYPKSLQNLILELNRTLNFPKNYSAASIMAAASSAIGKTVQIKVQNGWYEQAVVYLILSGRAGINKSHPLTFAIKPILKYDEIQKREYDLEYEKYEVVVDLSAKEKKEMGIEVLTEPVLKQILVNDITPEALQTVHNKNPRGLGLYRDEILGWINSFDRYSNSSELQIWLSLWSGTDARTNRTGRKAIYLSRPFVSVFGTIQDARLEDFAKGSLNSTGFTDRILFTFSENKFKPYMNEEELTDNYIHYYDQLINKLLHLQLEFNEQQQVQPRILNFSKEAKGRLLDWNKYNADLSNAHTTTEQQRSIYAKLDSYIARFTLILQMLHWADGESDLVEIKPEIVEKAIELTEYYRKNALYASLLINGSNQANSQSDPKQMARLLHTNKIPIRKIAEIVGKGKSTIGEWVK